MTQILDAITIETGANPGVSIIWMHGLGDSGAGFAGIVEQLDLTGCPAIRFIFPHAPVMPVTVNGGYPMPAWYDVYGNDLTQRQDEAGLRVSQKAIDQLIGREKTRGVATDHIILAGFSQGCAMTLQTGLRYPEKLGGLLCLSGYLPINTTVPTERSTANQDTPIFMVHGRLDPVIEIRRAHESRDFLQALGYSIEWHEYMMAHSVCDEEIAHIGLWLRNLLAK